MATTIAAIDVDGIAATLAARPEAALAVAVRRSEGGLAGGAGAAAAARLLGVDVVALAGAALPREHSTFTTGVVAVPSAGAVRRVVVVDIGELPPGRVLSGDALFGAALAASRAADGAIVSLLGLEVPDAAGLRLVAEGHAAGAWRYRREGAPLVARAEAECVIATTGIADAARILHRARIAADAVAWVRTVVETPPNLLGPRAFADAVASFAADCAGDAVSISVWDEATLAERGFGGTLGVGSGSVEPPLVIELRVDGSGLVTALAGKGITFDSGGLNLKRDLGEISWMKTDMAAAAAVAAAVIAAAALGGSGPLHAVLPVAENMPGGRAQRPGDVVRHPDGRTTEVVDTDCEGRLVLADALAWLVAARPARVIDVGTLTDSGAVGTAFWGCWGTSAVLAEEVLAAGRAAADPGWSLPLHESYAELLTSRVADIANTSVEGPDTGQLAATYLRAFVGDVPWVHIDNGSSAWLERDAAPWPAGPTATPVRALIELLVSQGE
ncbi:putative cytosol aminopeptidase [Leifsonia sp. LS1]|uniref:leucyl aminopeptidase family protein n=1 Tax=Leifsonia sp. LS1 TaxID=2828483 RepID=UPI001CFD992B|nr:M17 family metallopeptidase [Leifsonia sp. LS1]GIT81273.1 putative cytosol aminopeptidase [Leifsonia sp. LS1]